MFEGQRLVNYYEVLNVDEGACTEEIKRSFRKLVKECHPDRNGNTPWAESKVKQVIQAYKMLSDRSRRSHYDRMLNLARRRNGGSFYMGQHDTTSFRVKTILLDLLNQRGQQALADYDRLKKDVQDFHLLSYFSFKDFIDCTFLLAEECERQKRFVEALELYEEAYLRLEQGIKRRYLKDEIKDRIQRIYCRHLARRASPKKALSYYERVLELKLGKSEQAYVHKKMAECYLKLGDFYSAATYLDIALSLKPNLRGVQRIYEKLALHMPMNGLTIDHTQNGKK